MEKKIIYKVAIIGSGYMANEYAKVLKKIKYCEFSGVYSRTYSKAKKFGNKYRVKNIGKSISDLYKKTKANLVIVAISPDHLKSIVKEIYKFPWISLLEKPLGVNYEEAKFINNLVLKTKKKSFVALNRRHYSSTLKSIDFLKKDNSKRVVNIYGQEDLSSLKKYNFSKKILKNYMYVNGIHLIDYMTIFCRGKIKKIKKISKWKGFKNGYVFCVFYFTSGDTATFSTIWNKPFPWQVTVTTQKNRVVLKPLEYCKLLKINNKKVKNFKIDKIDKTFKPGLYKQTNEFVHSLKKKSKFLMKVDHGCKLMKFLNIIYS